MTTRIIATLVTVAALGATAGGAQAAPSIESIKFVTVYNPPGGGTPITRATEGPVGPGRTGATDINIDNDSASELTASVGLSFDADEKAVTGQLTISRIDFSLLDLEELPVRVEAVAVLMDTKNDAPVRKHIALGYDARESTAPGRFTVDIGSCTTPDCRSTPSVCASPCQGTKTTLAVNVVKPGPRSLKLVGELSDYAADGGHQDPTRAILDFSPVAGASSPLILTIWSTERRVVSLFAPHMRVETLTHISMDGNKEALKATARVCRLPGETYKPKQLGDTACEAAGYTDQQIDSRIVEATIDRLPRDIGPGKDLSVSVADNDRGADGGRQRIEYDASEPVRNIHVTDDVVTWSADGERREADRVYDLVRVPLSVDLDLLDESKAAGDDDAKPDQTVTYLADDRLTSADVNSTERVGGVLVNRQELHLETVPRKFTVVAEKTKQEVVIPGDRKDGFDRRVRQSVGLTHTSSPFGVVEYTSADGETTAAPPANIGNAYVYTNKPEDGTQFAKLRLLGLAQGNFTIGRHVQLAAWDSASDEEPREDEGLDLLSVDATLTPTPFRTLAEDGRRVFDVGVNDLPREVALTLEPEKGRIDYRAPSGDSIDELTVDAKDPDALFKRATRLDVSLKGVPSDVEVSYPSETNSDLNLEVDQGEIGELTLEALGDGDEVPAGVIGPDEDGVLLRDIEEEVEGPESYVMFARARGLRQVRYAKSTYRRNEETQQHIDRKEFALDLTSRRNFVVDLEQTGEVKKHTWEVWDVECESEVVGKRVERTRAVIVALPPQTTLSYDQRNAFGNRECREEAHPISRRIVKRDVTDIRYTAGGTAPALEFEDGSTNLRLELLTLPTKLRFCRAPASRDCLPSIADDDYGADLGSLTLDGNGYFTVNLVDCRGEFESSGKCETANARIHDLRLKQIDFWGDLDGQIHGTNGDVYLNTADYDYGAPTWNGVPWNGGPYTGDNQPLEGAASGRKARIKVPDVNLTFVQGFYARGAHIYWDWIADDSIGDWSPDGTGGTVHCPAGTHWEVDTGFPAGWVEVHEDWCNSGAANG